MNLEEYKNLIYDLLPQGRAWSRDQDSFLNRLVTAIADELVRVDGRVQDLVDEADPRFTFELIDEWERKVGIPDECTPTGAQTIQERRSAILQKMTTQWGQSKMFFEEVASQLGFDVEITDTFLTFRVGTSKVGERLYGSLWIHWWKVESDSTLERRFRVGQNTVGDPLLERNNGLLECTFKKLKPAHTNVYFEYGS